MVRESVVRLTAMSSHFHYGSNGMSGCGDDEHNLTIEWQGGIWQEITGTWQYAKQLSASLDRVHSFNVEIQWVVVEMMSVKQLTNQKLAFGRKSLEHGGTQMWCEGKPAKFTIPIWTQWWMVAEIVVTNKSTNQRLAFGQKSLEHHGMLMMSYLGELTVRTWVPY